MNPDNVDHTFFECTTLAQQRRQVEEAIGSSLSDTTMISHLIRNRPNWKLVESFVDNIMKLKE